MAGTGYQKTITYSLVAAAATGVALSQSGTAATPLTLNGSLVTAGVATLDSGGASRRVIITSAGDDSTHTFNVVGTDRYGRAQTEVLTGANGVAQTLHDFKTVTSITPNQNTTSTVTAGTNAVGSSDPWIIDAFANPQDFGCAVVVTGTVTYTIEESYDDLAPNWNLAANSYTFFADPTFNARSVNTNGVLSGPYTMIRLTINSGTGSATARIVQGGIFGRA